MKKNLKYYTRDAGAYRHPKFKILRKKFGWEADAKFWALNDMIAEADGCAINLSVMRNKVSVMAELEFDNEVSFDEFIQFLTSPLCELLVQLDDGFITTELIQQIYIDTMADREAERRKYEKRKRKNKDSDNGETELPDTNPPVKTEISSGVLETTPGEPCRQDNTKPDDTKRNKTGRGRRGAKVIPFNGGVPPTEDEVVQYFIESGYQPEAGRMAFRYYDAANWYDSKKNPVLNWKQKMIACWFTPERRIEQPTKKTETVF